LRGLILALTAGVLVACGPAATSGIPTATDSASSSFPTDSPSPPLPSVASGEPTGRPSPLAEGALLAGIRADVRATDCQQIQGDLPPGLAEVVFCEVGSELVDSVTFARYWTPDDLLDFYETRLAQFGIPLATEVGPSGQLPEDCWRGHPSESLYSPAGTGSETNREGCFVDENGHATQLYALGAPLVLLTVEGRAADIAALKAWSWYDAEGGEPALGGPGVWQPPA
jgi:hypothetical protein